MQLKTCQNCWQLSSAALRLCVRTAADDDVALTFESAAHACHQRRPETGHSRNSRIPVPRRPVLRHECQTNTPLPLRCRNGEVCWTCSLKCYLNSRSLSSKLNLHACVCYVMHALNMRLELGL